MNWRIKEAATASALYLAMSSGLQAGVFEPFSVIYNNQISPTSLLVIVEGHARYVAPQSSADSHALIQTTQYDTWNPQGEVGNAGAGFNANGPFQLGQVISCTDAQTGCPGRGYVPRRPCSVPAYRYRGRTGAVIYHQFEPEIRLLYGPTNRVPCIPDSPPPCGFQPWGEQTVLPVVGGPQVVHALVGEPYALSRTDERDGFRYLLEEWAVLAVDREPGGDLLAIETLAASSSAYGDFRRSGLAAAVEASSRPDARVTFDYVGRGPVIDYFRPGRSVVLVIDAPVHVHNQRWIATPVARWSGPTMASPVVAGRAVVRLDFAEDRSLIEFDVLYSDRPLSRDEHDLVERNLRLDYVSDTRHRAALFGVVKLGERIELERSVVTLPQCCCTGPSAICIPHPPQ